MYKPDQLASCCPHYTIRLDSDAFHVSKDQRQALNRFNKYILGDAYTKEAARLYPKSREQAKKRNTEFDLLERVQESETENLKIPPEPAHAFTITLEPDTVTEEKFALFENYQRIVHKEPPSKITRHGFKDFLCSSPLPRRTETFDGQQRRLGSYHQCYRIDGQLVAIGVLDLLPQCVSAVYFMYHESVHQHGFGKLGALREIALAKEAGYKWWYAGFYIHSCVKMRYKGDYSPQYILDPMSYAWDLLDDEVKKKLDTSKYVSLSGDRSEPQGIDGEVRLLESKSTLVDEDVPLFARGMPGILSKEHLLTDIDLDKIKLRIRGQDAETGDLVGWEDHDLDNPHSIKGIIADLVAAVGIDLAKEMIVTFN